MITWGPTVGYPIFATSNKPGNHFVLDKTKVHSFVFNGGITIK
ncbi:MAG TPA: hypothetical protein VER14_01590 [Phototrophicaceae bacterium]|nr:hypothetical protein [Phototrophicaceae bacterium]